MKQSFTLIISIFLSLYSLAQNPKVTADTFSFKQRLSNKTLILRSDSTYCVRESGCTHSHLSMGFWTKQNDTLSLNGLYYSSVKANTEMLANEDIDDSIVTFQVKDCYGNAISKYRIDFFTKDLIFDTTGISNYKTNDKGILKVKRKDFMLYSTETDQDNLSDVEGDYNDMYYRFVSPTAKRIIITLSYPKNFVDEKLIENFYLYRSRKFMFVGKQLVDFKSGYSYTIYGYSNFLLGATDCSGISSNPQLRIIYEKQDRRIELLYLNSKERVLQ